MPPKEIIHDGRRAAGRHRRPAVPLIRPLSSHTPTPPGVEENWEALARGCARTLLAWVARGDWWFNLVAFDPDGLAQVPLLTQTRAPSDERLGDRQQLLYLRFDRS